MKLQLLTMAIICTAGQLTAQTIGIGQNTPHPSTVLDVTSNSKGVLFPRMTTVQRNSIGSPAKGLLVYDSDLNSLYCFNGTAWATVGGGSVPFSLPYTASLSSDQPVFDITNTGSGNVIVVNKFAGSNAAVFALAKASSGVAAEGRIMASTGYGVYGANATGTAISGQVSGTGSALLGVANNASALALLANGKLRFDNNFTSGAPSKGAILTSLDNEGNAGWKARPQTAFRLNDTCTRWYSNLHLYQHNTNTKIEFVNEEYDWGGNIVPTPVNDYLQNSSTFIAPVAGIYVFDYAFAAEETSYFLDGTVTMIVQANNLEERIIDKNTISDASSNYLKSNKLSKLIFKGSVQTRLAAGEKVYLKFQPYLMQTINAVALYNSGINFFSGRLVITE